MMSVAIGHPVVRVRSLRREEVVVTFLPGAGVKVVTQLSHSRLDDAVG